MNRRTLLFTGAATLAACATPRSPNLDASLADDLDEAIGRVMALGLAPALSVAVYSPEAAVARAAGVNDLTTGERTTTDTAFYIASSTKSLTALALATQEARGEFDLGATLRAYAPDAGFPESVKPAEVTFRHLLSHTMGLDHGGIGFRLAYSGEHDPDLLWRLLSSCTPNPHAPLGAFEYSNLGYNIATILTDRKAGVRWQDMLARDIFNPAGMTRTSATMSRARTAGWSLARPHMVRADGVVAPIYLQKVDQTMQSAGGVIMSANDALRFLELMAEDGRVGGREILPRSVIAASRQPLTKVGDTFDGYRRDQYSLGWYTGPYRDEVLLHDFGAFAGFRAHVSYMPERRCGVAAFVNDSTVASPLVDVIANFMYDRAYGRDAAWQSFGEALSRTKDRAQRQVASRAADAEKRATRSWTLTRPLAAYAGIYENETIGRVEISVQDKSATFACGVLRSAAEPFTAPDSMRVEIAPGSGAPLRFEGDGPAPTALVLQGQRLLRTA